MKWLKNFNSWEFWINSISIIFVIILFMVPLHIFINIIRYNDPICDNEKQSKFILECIKTDTTKDFRAINACEQMSIRLYCK